MDDEIITSCDVTALSTCIARDDAIQVVRECLEKDVTLSESVDKIVEIVTICLKTTYFSYNNDILQQHSCEMGSAISLIVVNLHIERFEQDVLRNYPGTSPRLCVVYVEYTFIIINKRESNNFFKYINKVNQNIKFTQEECVDNMLAFLDCHVHLNPDKFLNSTVTYISILTDPSTPLSTATPPPPPHSHTEITIFSLTLIMHPPIHKLGVIRTFHYRANTVTSNPMISRKRTITSTNRWASVDVQTGLSPKLIKPISNPSHLHLTRIKTSPSKLAK